MGFTAEPLTTNPTRRHTSRPLWCANRCLLLDRRVASPPEVEIIHLPDPDDDAGD